MQDAALIAEASAIAADNHKSLRDRYPWMPEKRMDEFVPRVEWMTREGRVYGLEDEGSLRAFIGWFKIDDFRNLGAGALTPDWCAGVAISPGAAPTRSAAQTHGVGPSRGEVSRLLSPLVRRLMSDLKNESIPIHAIGITSTNEAFLEEFSMLSYGRIVLDAARNAADLLAATEARQTGYAIRAATRADAKMLAELDGNLARHIGSPPVLMPDAHGSTESEWEKWIDNPDALTFVAERKGARESERELVGFIKADPPHFDVSWFVHGAETLAICGLYVDPRSRGHGVGEALLRSLVTEGIARGHSLVSVDCETHNPEARAFWLSRFEPVTWSFERRF
jgi:GNAT superfamily N-acetyltransferase